MPSTEIAMLLLDADPAARDRLRDIASGGSIAEADGIDEGVRALHRGHVDLIVIGGPCRTDRGALQRLRSAGRSAAIVVLVAEGEAGLVLDPQDVGIRSTIDLGSLDDMSLQLSLQLAVERHRLAIAQMEAARSAEELSRVRGARDPLTGLPRGELLLEEVDRFLADAVRFSRPFSVALVQIDGLEACRIAEGSAVADSVVIHAAGVMGQCLRTSDLLGRLDDNQLLVAMPGTGADAATGAVMRINEQLASAPCRIGHQTRAVTATVGISSLVGLMSVDEIVFAADTALRDAQAAAAFHRVS